LYSFFAMNRTDIASPHPRPAPRVLTQALPTNAGRGSIFETTAKSLLRVLGLAFMLAGLAAWAEQSVVTLPSDDGNRISYLLVTKSSAPKYTIIGFPGGAGFFGARLEDGQIRFAAAGNFVIRTRDLMVDDEFAMALTDATSLAERMSPIIADLRQRFPATKIYLMSTSLGTIDSANLSLSLGNQISGAIHTSSMSKLAAFPFDKTVVRQLLVHHINDGCHVTSYGSARYVSEKHGITLITITGGVGSGDPCEAFSHHGYRGREQETIDAIKAWVKDEKAAAASGR
jgi:hypothetical protein